ncbi:hypothetical protein J6590_072834 [Homalodisca vitripennis]|nr:hypothetical protein J6590_072834 [Homalodisca vitripennis]
MENNIITKTDDSKMCEVNVKEDEGLVNIHNLMESSTNLENEVRSAMNIDDDKPPVPNEISEKSLVTNVTVEIGKPLALNSDESVLFVRNVETSIHVQKPASGRNEDMVNKNVDEALKPYEEQVETTNLERNKMARGVDMSEDAGEKSGSNCESKLSESGCNQEEQLQQNVPTKLYSLKACKTNAICQTKIDVLDQKNGEKTENMYLKIHEKEAVVELNNEKDLETENVDGHETFDTKPNECAGGNDTSKNTCNSPGSIFLENNVTQVNKEAKNTKDMETNSRLESEIVTNKEKQQDKALVNHAHILQITKLQEKLAQSLNIMNINMNSSQVRQNKNVQNNLKCNTSVEKPDETHSVTTAAKTFSKFKTSDVEGKVSNIVHMKINHNTSSPVNETTVKDFGHVGENLTQGKELCCVINDKHQTLSGNSSEVSIKSFTESNINLSMQPGMRSFDGSSLTESVIMLLDKNPSETPPPVFKDGMGRKEDSRDCTSFEDNVELCNDQYAVDVVEKTKTNVLQYKKGQNKQVNKQISKNSSLDKNKVRKTTELQEQLREFTSQVKQLDKQLTAKKHAIDISEEETDKTLCIKRQRKSIDQMSESKESSRPTVSQAKTNDSKDRDRNVPKVPTHKKSLSLEQKVNKLRNERKSLDINPVTISQLESDFTGTIINNGTSATSGENITQVVSDDTINTSPELVPSAGLVSASTERTNLEEQRHQNFQTIRTSVESPKSQTMQPNLTSSKESSHLQNAKKTQPLSTVRQNAQMNVKENNMVMKAANIYTFYFGQPFDVIPGEIVENIGEFMTSTRMNVPDYTTNTIVYFYMYIYYIKFSDEINVKVNKTAELLHLAIADCNRKFERIERAKRLTSEILRYEEIKRANDDYAEMLNLRSFKLKELFLSVLEKCEFCELVILTAMYFRITQSLLNIDRENINYIYNLRKLIKGLMKVQGNIFSKAFNYLFELEEGPFSVLYTFVKRCIVSLYVSGYKEEGSDDILRLAHLDPCGPKMQDLLAKYNGQQETGTRRTQVIRSAQAKNDTVLSVVNERLVHHLTTSSTRLTSKNKNIQPLGSVDSAHQSAEAIPNVAKQQVCTVNVNNSPTVNSIAIANSTPVANRVPYGTNSGIATNFSYQLQNQSQFQTSSQGIKLTNAPTQSVVLQPNNEGASIQNHIIPQLPVGGQPNSLQDRPPPPPYNTVQYRLGFSTNIAQQQQNHKVPLMHQILSNAPTPQLQNHMLNNSRTHTRQNIGSFSNPPYMTHQFQGSNQNERPQAAALNRLLYQPVAMQQNSISASVENSRNWHQYQQLHRTNVRNGNPVGQQLLTSIREDSVNEVPLQLQDPFENFNTSQSRITTLNLLPGNCLDMEPGSKVQSPRITNYWFIIALYFDAIVHLLWELPKEIYINMFAAGVNSGYHCYAALGAGVVSDCATQWIFPRDQVVYNNQALGVCGVRSSLLWNFPTTKCELRSVIHFLRAGGNSAAETHESMCCVYGESINDVVVHDGVKSFKMKTSSAAFIIQYNIPQQRKQKSSPQVPSGPGRRTHNVKEVLPYQRKQQGSKFLLKQNNDEMKP